MYKLGIDLGGTKIEGVVLDPNNNESLRKRIPTEREQGYDAILNKIHSLYTELTNHIDNQEHSFGIGTPGSISKDSSLLKNSNTVCMNGKPLLEDLKKKLNHSVSIENDANCFAMAEAVLGAGKQNSFVFGVIIGTGCGGGLIINGQLRKGPHDGEWGHMIMDPSGPEHYRGFPGVIENYISGAGIESLYEVEYMQKKSLKDIVDDFRSGKENEVIFMDQFLENFGTAMANLINGVDPDLIVLGGGVSNIDELYTLGLERVQKHFDEPLQSPIIVRHQLGDSAGVLGAALIGS